MEPPPCTITDDPNIPYDSEDYFYAYDFIMLIKKRAIVSVGLIITELYRANMISNSNMNLSEVRRKTQVGRGWREGPLQCISVPPEWHGWLHFITDHTGDEVSFLI